jgi:hypothetical protein
MARVLLWLVLIALLVRAVSRLVKGVLDGAGYRLGHAEPAGVGLVRDPVCGTFVVPGKALVIGEGRDRRYFCSDRCRREWRAAPR